MKVPESATSNVMKHSGLNRVSVLSWITLNRCDLNEVFIFATLKHKKLFYIKVVTFYFLKSSKWTGPYNTLQWSLNCDESEFKI